VAKEQGLRSRAAFKLSQINRKFPLLEKATTVLDLCAAPGGWTQIAARTCRSTTKIVAVDILPIRSFGGHPNITRLIGDITTDKCKSDVQHALAGSQCQVVMHDGAPNVGADYGKDAYEQNEIALHAVKCATQHLVRGGAFITKVYRSRDYAAFQWLLQQLFEEVQAFKPKASRAQSAEIFLVCRDYKAPAKLDPRMLDPKYVFASVEGETTGGEIGGADKKNMTVFHKDWDKKVRKRGGYDHEHLDMSMRHVETIDSFIDSAGMKDAIQVLSQSTGLKFQCETCLEQPDEDKTEPTCRCSYYLNHPLTTPEIKECVSDLQVLNKADFKGLLTWRTKMIEAVKDRKQQEHEDAKKDGDEMSVSGGSSDEDGSDNDRDADRDSDKEEGQIQAEISAMRQRRMREQNKKKKKERAAAAKRRRHAALGMDLNAIDVPDHDKIFSLASITSKGDLEAAAEVNLGEVTDEQIFGDSDDDVVVGEDPDDNDGSDDEVNRLRKREGELDDAYNMYLQNTKNGVAKSGTRFAKRSKKAQRVKAMEEAEEDQDMAMLDTAYVSNDTKTYAKMLQGPKDSDDEDSSSDEEEDDDGFKADPMTPEEHARAKKQRTADKNPLIHQFAEEATSAKTARWFSNPLFATIGKTAQSAATVQNDNVDDGDGDSKMEESSDDEDISKAEPQKKQANKTKVGLYAEEVIANMPKTDKEVRHERRLKAMARDERKKAKRAKKMGEAEKGFELAPANDSDNEEVDAKLDHLSEAQRKKVLAARDLIKAGMGSAIDKEDLNSKIELVAQGESNPLPRMDDRKYDSGNEDYDSDDYAQTLALGTMMLRRSKEKALVDASYNRYAWNDPQGLPEWFVDDENKNYRPQLPIPPALIAKMKEKMMALSVKPIAKVAEARARKNKRAKLKLSAAKKQAETVANAPDMSEAMKLKAISKALRGQDARRPGKSYVVAKKGRGNTGAKGAKVVDKRMKSDKRGMDRAANKKAGKAPKFRKGR